MLKKLVLFCVFAGILSVSFSGVHAADNPAASQKDYFYKQFNTSVIVNSDSTVDVTEYEEFQFIGSFNYAFRNIPLTKIDRVSDIRVFDAATKQPLAYSSKQLDKLNPDSWGKYTYFRANGNQNIVWYFDLKNTSHSWIVKYKVHGAIEFGKITDRLYWNIFTEFDKPIVSSAATVELPLGIPKKSIISNAYRSGSSKLQSSFVSDNKVSFLGKDFILQEAFTVDVTFPSGFVSRSVYWRGFVVSFWGYLASVLVILLSFLAAFILWLKREKLPKGRGVIVPQYEPPQNLRPAMAESILKEKVTDKGLAATVVDLAVRGHIKIEEDSEKVWYEGLFKGTAQQTRLFILLAIAVSFIIGSYWQSNTFQVLPIIIIALVALSALSLVYANFRVKHYNLFLNVGAKSAVPLEDFEKEYLRILLEIGGNPFSTKALRKAGNFTKKKMFTEIEKLKKSIYHETQMDTKAFQVDPAITFKKRWILNLAWIMPVFLSIIAGRSGTTEFIFSQVGVFIIAFMISVIGLYSYIRYEARLNAEGRILRDDWFGFREFLYTAERYRLQNLKPEMFEKFLPYAMIFGIEKKWAKAFEGLNLPNPDWYRGAGGGVYIGSASSGASNGNGIGGSFSPVGFSSSFSSAFTSSFSSTGASGGGGGGAGGGGGGGGGGAG